MRLLGTLALLAGLSASPALAKEPLSPCEAYGAAEAVFIGQAGAPVQRWVHATDDHSPLVPGKFSPMTVERAFRGVSTPIVYLTPAGIAVYLTPGQRYLVYGRHYAGPDMFMTADAYGTKPMSAADHDLEFLDVIAATASGATISGVLELDESDAAHIGSEISPLGNIAMRLSTGNFVTTVVSSADGYFSLTGLPSGAYRADPQLPDDLMLSDNPAPSTNVLQGGCASMRLRVVPNGRISGFVTDGYLHRAIRHVSLMPADLKRGDADRWFAQVLVDSQGHFEFKGVRPGRYMLGSQGVTSAYYPGTADRESATIVVVGRSGIQDVGEFHIPSIGKP